MTSIEIYNHVFKAYTKLLIETEGLICMSSDLKILIPSNIKSDCYFYGDNEIPITALDLIQKNFPFSNVEFHNSDTFCVLGVNS